MPPQELESKKCSSDQDHGRSLPANKDQIFVLANLDPKRMLPQPVKSNVAGEGEEREEEQSTQRQEGRRQTGASFLIKPRGDGRGCRYEQTDDRCNGIARLFDATHTVCCRFIFPEGTHLQLDRTKE